MTGQTSSRNPAAAKLTGYVNPLEMTPSFLLPVFERNGELLLQESNPNETIKNFYPFDRDEFGKIGSLNCKLWAGPGDETIYAFVFPSGALAVGTKQEVAAQLLRDRKMLTKYRFLYFEVLDFLQLYDDLDSQLKDSKLEKAPFRDNPLLKSWADTERRAILEKKTPADEEISSPVSVKLGINLPKQFIKRFEEIRSRRQRPQKVGFICSDKMMKTVVVRVDRLVLHPKYRRYVRRTSKFMAHDELGCTIGDKVRIVETRPLSARKRWRVSEIIQKASH
jgi:small subunit ribosomal protein S17